MMNGLDQIADIKVQDPVESLRQKIVPLSASGSPVRFPLGRPEEPVRCPFHPSAYDGGITSVQLPNPRRLNMPLELTVDTAAKIQQIEAHVLEQILADAPRFGLVAPVVQQIWKSALREHHAVPHLRCKVTLTGEHAVRCWLPDGARAPVPENLAGSNVCATIWARYVWFSPAAAGVLFEVTDLLLAQTAAEVKSPWA